MGWITETILRRYGIAGSIIAERELDGGNVNRTYCVSVRDGARLTRYLVQKLNPEAVRQPRLMLRNMVVVTDHLLRKGIRTAKLYPVGVSGERFLELRRHSAVGRMTAYAAAASDRSTGNVSAYAAAAGRTSFGAESGSAQERAVGQHPQYHAEYWRVEEYLESAEVSQSDSDVLYRMARAFGQFDAALSDLPPKRLRGAERGFHDTYTWFRQLWKAADEDVCGRTAEVRGELVRLKELEEEACEISLRYAAGDFPIRVVHNDTKFNNVLFTSAKPPYDAVVIDFDTVMEGMIAYDFADSVRSTAKIIGGTADEPAVRLDTDRFRIIAKGYLDETRSILTDGEIAAMAPCTLAITAELSARYLTDYLNGDVYFKIEEPLQNLRKAKLNLAFAQDIKNRMDELRTVVDEVAGFNPGHR